jgi:formylglycine-generating enzyme required for sulfatase activity
VVQFLGFIIIIPEPYKNIQAKLEELANRIKKQSEEHEASMRIQARLSETQNKSDGKPSLSSQDHMLMERAQKGLEQLSDKYERFRLIVLDMFSSSVSGLTQGYINQCFSMIEEYIELLLDIQSVAGFETSQRAGRLKTFMFKWMNAYLEPVLLIEEALKTVMDSDQMLWSDISSELKEKISKDNNTLELGPYTTFMISKRDQAVWRIRIVNAIEETPPRRYQRDLITMVYVPAGEFRMGSIKESLRKFVDHPDHYNKEFPQHMVKLDAFWISKYQITNAQYAMFLNAMGNQEEGGVTWLKADGYGVRIHKLGGGWRADSGYADHPVVGVSWYGARAYAEWIGACLPTEAEWEKAARGTDGRIYPWGNELPTDDLCNFGDRDRGTTPVGKYSSQGDSPYGCADMAGNVREWTRSLGAILFENRRLFGAFDYPYDATDGRESPNLAVDPQLIPKYVLEDSQGAKGVPVFRGGAFSDDPNRVRCACRREEPPNHPRQHPLYSYIGFRVVVSPYL